MIVLSVEPNFVSPYVFACFVTLKEKKQAFEIDVVHADKGDTMTASYLDKTLTGRVPTLAHDDFALAESSAIVEYLEDTFPDPPVLPRDRHARARARQMMSWLRSDDTAPIREERPATGIFYPSTQRGTPLSDKTKRVAEKLFGVASRVIGARSGWSIVDAELTFMLQRLITSGDTVPDELRSFASEQWKRPSIQAYVALERPPL